MRVVLSAMPWHAVHRPSLAVGLLNGLVRRDRPEAEVVEFHGGIRWMEFLLSTGELGVADYVDVAENGVLHGTGEWVFAGGLYDDPGWRVEEFRAYAAERDIDISSLLRMRDLAQPFLDEAAAEILAAEPDVVGFTSTFMQNVASLALARRLKRLRPSIRVVFGGANCDGPMGAALHRNHRFVDLVVRGEAEEVFPALLDRLADGEDPADLPGVCWWDGERPRANPQATHAVPPAMISSPDFDAWHEAFASSPVREHVTPELLIEGSRGCWWGEKHQCTFCGLNGSMIAFRAKPADKFWTELSDLVERHQILDVVTVDDILDMGAFSTLLPRMAESGWDLRVHYEIKSNLRPAQVEALAAAGIAMVQPGIESLSGRVLKIMDKGVDGAMNVRLLRDCEDNGLTVTWNYLYGFPGELADDYWGVIEQLGALVHLQPPSGAVRLVLERFSPYFERPELGFPRRAAAAAYAHTYDLPDAELDDLAYFFDTDEAGISGPIVEALDAALNRWKRDYPYSYLTVVDRDGEVLIEDRRRGRPEALHRLTGWRAEAHRALSRPRSSRAVHDHLAKHGHAVERSAVEAWLAASHRDGLVFRDGASWVALATNGAPHRIPEGAPR
ncbi:RiPP maturation radical SAM C-methyltransferase [Actinomadura rubrisoli]|uniref:RiPP maturation radical SAM protein 1 n=1 Tax=Actinomadura rubrisoli TaxID=2530368 RepID=A0A4R5BK30_9ACTN|nr:RiPP maturation radical SAM C-methyltransferase [Actinomadura rubrisoli]TDD87138.1 RiPP maturation radical SAM protein 1 [Actinomadura rubrisoli]